MKKKNYRFDKFQVHEDGNDPFGEDGEQEALEAIAKKFEEKYVSSSRLM